MDEPVVISVVVVNWNTRDILEECLGKIADAVSPLRSEVLVVDNNSDDGSTGMVRQKYPEVRLLENTENLGFPKAVNQGISASSGEFIALVNSDVMVPPGVLVKLAEFLENNPRAAAVAPQLEGRSGWLQDSGGYAPGPMSALMQTFSIRQLRHGRVHGLFVRSSEREAEALKVDWLGAACMVLKRKAVDEAGLLDDEYFMYAEDMEYGLRLKGLGWDSYLLPWARVIHYGGASTSKIPEARLLWLAGVFRIAAGQLSGPKYTVFGILLSLSFLLRFLFMGLLLRVFPERRRRMRAEGIRARNTFLYLRAAARLACRSRSYAARYSRQIEGKCRLK